MLGRSSRPVKVYCVLPRAGLRTFLQHAGWRGPLHALDSLLDRFCPSQRIGDDIFVDLTLSDFDRDGGNRVGISFSPQHLAVSQERDPGRGPLLVDCMQAGLCTKEHSKTLRAWPGSKLMNTGAHGNMPTTVQRWLDIKVVWSPDEPLEMKAYLGIAARAATLVERLAC